MPGRLKTVDAILAQTDWHAERKALRAVLCDCGLTETVKWGALCYTHGDGNVAIVFALKDCCGIGFFKGALLDDPDGRLFRPSENTQSSRQLRFTTLDEIAGADAVIRDFAVKAMAVEDSGERVALTARHDLDHPDELVDAFDADPDFRGAFDALTPGRQRAFNLHFAAAKQSATRAKRIEDSRDRIIAGKGPQDCICGRSKRYPRCDGSHARPV